MSDLLAAFGLMLVIEGALYALFPGLPRRVIALVAATPEETVRRLGLGVAVAGVALVWLVRG
ncbi:MAG: DUF2065 domain-containing protein [Alphaproteobacteria bacterium]|nr:DUF2065 domain-containing protein [Alphaproteobacteria bacterium]MDX5370612.1 DUF2065 domain-containing protein [Alphaproteobacteria bacterium]MDX5465056.1 DUF2065 domain-containing protein [Alphaproteobacteria bacterium]